LIRWLKNNTSFHLQTSSTNQETHTSTHSGQIKTKIEELEQEKLSLGVGTICRHWGRQRKEQAGTHSCGGNESQYQNRIWPAKQEASR
jgi:hypothetical protein